MARKLKHSKIKNTGILFELLTRQITADVLNNKESKSVRLIKQYFNQGIMEISDLGKESLFDLINKKKNKFLEYTKILDLLIKMQKIKIKQNKNTMKSKYK